MPKTPAMTTGMIDLITMSGRITPMDEMPTPDFAVPYAAPKFAKTIAEVTPMKPKKADDGSHGCMALSVLARFEVFRRLGAAPGELLVRKMP
mmetsp:Transcript_124087/g.347497  ORF Transcript_124087/g.347497 Transcript_124087/m.347497 type:complete len:92 (-) Transcript_124087:2-277(-)